MQHHTLHHSCSKVTLLFTDLKTFCTLQKGVHLNASDRKHHLKDLTSLLVRNLPFFPFTLTLKCVNFTLFLLVLEQLPFILSLLLVICIKANQLPTDRLCICALTTSMYME